MSLRLIKKYHPRTGRQLAPVFVSERTGRVYWPILGAAENDGDDDSKGDGSDDTKGDDKGADKDKDSDSEDQDDKSKKDDGDKPVTKAELDAVTARMKAADKRAAAAEAKAKEYEDKDKTELEKAQGEVKTVTAERDKLIETIKSLRLDNAFALNRSHQWHDPEVVMELVRKRDDVTIDEDGKVTGMDTALKAIAKDKKYLVKSDEENDDDGDGPPASGSNVGSGKGKDQKALEATARRKFRV